MTSRRGEPLGFNMFKDQRIKPTYSKSTRLKLDLPSYFIPPNQEYIKARKRIEPRRFCDRVFAEADVRRLLSKSTCDDISAKNRNAIITTMTKARLVSSIHFDRTELSILLHMYVQLTGLEMRDMTPEEMKSFLYSTLDITNPFSLDGLCRAALMQSKHTVTILRKTINPLDFLQTLSTLLRGKILDRAELAFHVMDIDSDGLLRKQVEFRRLLFDTFDVFVAAQNPEIDPDEPMRDTLNYLCDRLDCTINQPITMIKFKNLVQEEPWIIECLLPCIPSESINILFQSLFSTTVQLPSLENPPDVIRRKHSEKF